MPDHLLSCLRRQTRCQANSCPVRGDRPNARPSLVLREETGQIPGSFVLREGTNQANIGKGGFEQKLPTGRSAIFCISVGQRSLRQVKLENFVADNPDCMDCSVGEKTSLMLRLTMIISQNQGFYMVLAINDYQVLLVIPKISSLDTTTKSCLSTNGFGVLSGLALSISSRIFTHGIS